MKNVLQKGISPLVSIVIILVITVIAIAGVFAYQYYSAPKEEAKMPEIAPPTPTPTTTPSITVLSPNGGEVWQVGKTYNITWTVPYEPQIGFDGKPIERITIIIERPPTEKYFSAGIASDIPVSQGKFSWTIPSSIPAAKFDFTTSSNYKVSLYYREAKINSSDNYFTIVAAGNLPD